MRNGKVTGWLFDEKSPTARVEFELLVNDRSVGRFVADRWREDLARRGVGDGKHGFSVPLDSKWLGEGENTIRIGTTPAYAGGGERLSFRGAAPREDEVRYLPAEAPKPAAKAPRKKAAAKTAAGAPAKPVTAKEEKPVRPAAAAAAAAAALRETLANIQPISDWSPPSLARFADSTVEVKVGGAPVTIGFGQALAILHDQAKDAIHPHVLQSLAESHARLSLVLIDRAVRRGEMRLDPPLEARVRLAALRLLASLNAGDSAHALIADFETGAFTERLTEAERIRVQFAIARAKLRAGRTDEAIEHYRRLMLEHPGRAEAIMQFILGIYASKPEAAAALAAVALGGTYPINPAERLFLGEVCLRAGDRLRATEAFLKVATGAVHAADGYIGLANAALIAGERDDWLAYIQHYARLTGMELAGFDADEPLAPFAFCAPAYPRSGDHPKIAVVMTCFNAAETLPRAVRSIQDQTLTNLEIWVVDDLSQDGSASVAEALAAQDPRIHVLRNTANLGTYASKNRALRQTDAEYVALHDSDDWAHPRKLEVQLEALADPIACTTSNWIRMDKDGEVYVRRGGPYSHLNPASTFLRRAVFDEIGYFDEVRTGGDAEFIARLRAQFGWSSIQNCGKSLAIGLHHEASLTTSGAAAFDEHRYSPVRLAYTEAWLEWQLRQLEASAPVSLPGEGRPFEVPAEVRVDRAPEASVTRAAPRRVARTSGRGKAE